MHWEKKGDPTCMHAQRHNQGEKKSSKLRLSASFGRRSINLERGREKRGKGAMR